MKEKRYKRMRKAIIASAGTSIVTGMLFFGAGNTALAESSDLSVAPYSQNTTAKGMHMMHRWNSVGRAGSLAVHLGLDPEKVKTELKDGKTLKQILQENGIVPGQLQKAFEGKKSYSKRMWKKMNGTGTL